MPTSDRRLEGNQNPCRHDASGRDIEQIMSVLKIVRRLCSSIRPDAIAVCVMEA